MRLNLITLITLLAIINQSKQKFEIIITLELIIQMTKGYQDLNYQATDLVSYNETKTTIDLTWTNPITDYDNLTLSFNIEEENKTYEIILNKNIAIYSITNLKPGSNLIISLFTIKNKTKIASSDLLYSYTAIDPVKGLISISATSTSIDGKIIIPDGYYDVIGFECINTADSKDQNTNILSPGSSFFVCFNLNPGYNYSILFVTVNKEKSNYAFSDMFYMNTELETAQINSIENPSGALELTLVKPVGNYDHIEITIKLITSKSNEYFIDITKVTNCNVGTSSIYTYKKNEIVDLNITDLCMYSGYNVVVKTILDGFQTVQVSDQFETDYGNIDCTTVVLKTIGNMSTISWEKPNFNLDYYLIHLSETEFHSDYNFNISKNDNSINVFNLSYNHEYYFAIKTKATVKTIDLKPVDIYSKNCSKTLITGPPCPSMNGKPILLYAPYVNNVTISIDASIFTSLELIYELTVYVGVDYDCDSSILYFNLSTEAVCKSNYTFCNKQFVLDKDYYITIELNGLCDKIVSDSLIINIPTQFPLGSVIAITVSISISIVVILLTITIILTFIHIKKKHFEEVQYLNLNKQTKTKINDEYVVSTPF